MSQKESLDYYQSLFKYQRHSTRQVKVGSVTIGGAAPVRIQSMTTTNTMDTQATVNQTISIAHAGGELVRITTQGRREADNLKAIKEMLKTKGCLIPLAADVHFNPAAAETAAAIVEKVRINPGNFAGGAKKFQQIKATDAGEANEIQQIRDRLGPLLKICKQHGTALRIGTNHGSLSDRIMLRYGDTPEGMVESCMEYLSICREEDFHDIVLSIKSSNTRVMVHTVRLLVATMNKAGMSYPLHLGVTEAGSGEDGRLKSAVGIGALLADGIGDTIRVSLTEDPEKEISVARKLVQYIAEREGHSRVESVKTTHYQPYSYHKRTTHEVLNTGGNQPAAVVADLRATTGFENSAPAPELALCQSPEQPLPKNWNQTVRVVPFENLSQNPKKEIIPLFDNPNSKEWERYKGACLLLLSYPQLTLELKARLSKKPETILLATSSNKNSPAEQRAFFLSLQNTQISNPVIIYRDYEETDLESLQIKTAADTGLLFLDGYGDGICISAPHHGVDTLINLQLGILQASRVRFSKTEYISCPGCGRTLFDLQETTARVQAQTVHLKNLKIAIMGCIVNGIGEMADADYGYVGAGPGKVSLYRNRELVKRNLPEKEAVPELIKLIKSYDDWTNPE